MSAVLRPKYILAPTLTLANADVKAGFAYAWDDVELTLGCQHVSTLEEGSVVLLIDHNKNGRVTPVSLCYWNPEVKQLQAL